MAWFAAHLLAEQRLPEWATGGRVVGVGGQTARPVDDIGALTEEGGWVQVQVKKGLSLGTKSDSPLGKALAQAVEATCKGVPERRASEALRPLEPDTDCLLILGDHKSPQTVATALSNVVQRLRRWPNNVPLAEAGTNEKERAAREVLFQHLGRCWMEQRNVTLAETDLRLLLRSLGVFCLELQEGGSDRRAVQVMLTELVSDHEKAESLWHALLAIGVQLATDRTWADRAGLVAKLETQGIVLRPVARLRLDIEQLRRITAANLDPSSNEITLATPEGNLVVPRILESVLADATGNLAVTGEPGTGKTGLLCILAADLLSRKQDVLFLSADQLRPTAGQTREELNLKYDIDAVLQGWTGAHPAVLILDGLDQTRGRDPSSWLFKLARTLKGSRWRIVASIRSFDLAHSDRWRATFQGEPIDSAHIDPSLSNVRHLLISDFSVGELRWISDASPGLAGLLDVAEEGYRQILANPFNLNIAAQLLTEGALTETDRFDSRLELLDRYWQKRVVGDDAAGYDRSNALRLVSERMLAKRRQHLNLPAELPAEVSGSVLSGLVSDNVLHELPRVLGQPHAPISFAHPVLFDYAVAVLALGDVSDSQSLAGQLDADPDLALVARPSLDYRLALEWRRDSSRRGFWQLALRLAASDPGHEIAAAAAAAVCGRELRTLRDLADLVDACTSRPGSAERQRWTVADARKLAFLIAAAIGAAEGNRPQLEAYTAFTAELADLAHNNDEVDLSLFASQLLTRAVGKRKLDPDSPAARNLVQAATACMEVALADPSADGRPRLGAGSANVFATSVVLDPDGTKAALMEVISSATMSVWDYDVVRRLIDQIPAIIVKDPAAAVEIAASVWEFEETRDEATSMMHSQIFDLRSNRKQDLESLRYTVGEVFPKMAASNLTAAAQLLLRIVERTQMLQSWHTAISAGAPPHVRYGDNLRYTGGHGAAATIADALVDQIQTASDRVLDQGLQPVSDEVQSSGIDLGQVVGLLAEKLTHSGVWERLLYHAASAPSLAMARHLAPLLSRSLFACDDTWLAAGHLFQRTSPVLEAEEHYAIEAAILSATEPSRGPEEEQWLLHRRDTLLRATDPEHISHPSAQEHLQDLMESGRESRSLPPLVSPEERHDAEWTVEEDEAPETSGAHSGLNRVLREVAGAVDQVQSNHDDQRAAGWRRLADSWLDLSRALESQTDRDPSNDHESQLVLMRGACSLAHHSETVPDSELGSRVIATLRAALPPVAEQQHDDSLPADWSGAWGVTVDTEALQGIATLIRWSTWRTARGEELSNLLHPYLDSPSPIYRLLSGQVLASIFTSSAEVLQQLEVRLSRERHYPVLAVLMQVLRRQVSQDPLEVDGILDRLAAQSHWAILAAEPVADAALKSEDHLDIPLHAITGLAAVHGTPYARRTVEAWMSQPLANPNRTIRVISYLRDYLNPHEPSLLEAQERAFKLLELPVASVCSVWRELAKSATRSPDQDEVLSNAVGIAEGATSQIYYASGATSQKKEGSPQESDKRDLDRFSEFALPLLEEYAAVHYPAVVHHVIETIDYVASLNPKYALLIATQAATANDSYAYESLAVDAVLKLIKRYMANHRELVIGDSECTSAVRKLIESLVQAGWEKAILFAEEMDVYFR
ncbi:hypothetical protein GCM10009853_072610 [Glycomyces scopariae]